MAKGTLKVLEWERSVYAVSFIWSGLYCSHSVWITWYVPLLPLSHNQEFQFHRIDWSHKWFKTSNLVALTSCPVVDGNPLHWLIECCWIWCPSPSQLAPPRLQDETPEHLPPLLACSETLFQSALWDPGSPPVSLWRSHHCLPDWERVFTVWRHPQRIWKGVSQIPVPGGSDML